MERPFRRVRLLSLILLSAVVASGARAAAIEKKDQIQVAALALPGGPQADLAAVGFVSHQRVKKLGADFQPALRDQLGETFLDSRYQLVQLLRAGECRSRAPTVCRRVESVSAHSQTSDSRRHAANILALFARWMRQALFPVSGSAWEFFALRRMRYGAQLG